MAERKLLGRFGVEISGIDVARAGRNTIEELQTLLDEHGLVVVRRQLLDDHALNAFAEHIGDSRLEQSAASVAHSPVVKNIVYLTNLRDEMGKPLGLGGRDTGYWHSDQAFRLEPATLSLLYCVIPPSGGGGATSFASTRLSNLSLDADTLKRVESLWGTYEPAPGHDNVRHSEVAHPVLIQSPRSGEVSVYVSEHTKQFVGLSPEESVELRERLLQPILAQANRYSHPWQMGDLVLYDNAQLLHRRESYEGMRFLKGAKIFAPRDKFAVPAGRVVQ